jgi:opacity protein-like surface antigen
MKFYSAARFLGLTLAAVPFLLPSSARAQADFSAQRPANVLVFGGYSYTMPDYNSGHNNGVTFGADYNRSFGSRVVPGLEARVNLNSGPYVNEHTYLVGPRAQVKYRRYHPYADFLVGLGTIHYPNYDLGRYVDDSGFTYAAGAGVDVDLVRHFALRADYHFESWNLGQNVTIKPDGSNFTLSPRTLMVGVTYRIPFRSWTDQKHESR